MGLYDPTFIRKEFTIPQREGEIPGSIVLGAKTQNKGCVWPGKGGVWFAAFAGHEPGTVFPEFPTRDEAIASIVAPLRRIHDEREDAREKAWRDAAPKREARAAAAQEREAKRKARKSDSTWAVLNEQHVEVGHIVRKTKLDAEKGAASLLGFSRLPDGYRVCLLSEQQ